MAEFPLMPNLSKILLTAASMQCSEEVLSIVSMLSVNHIFVRPKAKKKEADVAKIKFNDQYGDHLVCKISSYRASSSRFHPKNGLTVFI